MVTLSHDYVSQYKIIEEFRRNDIIQHVIYILTLRETHD